LDYSDLDSNPADTQLVTSLGTSVDRVSAEGLIDKVLRPTRHKIDHFSVCYRGHCVHFRDLLPSQSLGFSTEQCNGVSVVDQDGQRPLLSQSL